MKPTLTFKEKLFAMLCNKSITRWEDVDKKHLPPEILKSNQQKEWKKFWSKMKMPIPELKDKILVDYGCGYGFDSLLMLEGGAKHVYSLDVVPCRLEDAQRIHRANGFENVTYVNNSNPAELAKIIGEETVDILVSRNVMEHVPNPPGVLESMHKILKSGGTAYVGFSPLYKSPFGPHFSRKCGCPWVHMLFSEKTILKVFKQLYGLADVVKCYQDIPGSGVNKMSYYRYRDMLRQLGWDIPFLEVNQTLGKKKIPMCAINTLKFLLPSKGLKELLIFSSYAKMVKR
ncbi:MAG: class I SAM-dependent methyltransferase [bacterium]|nr:class I SAM-dependent methyltransferase [bacterium]